MVFNIKYILKFHFLLILIILMPLNSLAQIRFVTPEQQKAKFAEPAEVRSFTDSLFSDADEIFVPFPAIGLDDRKTQALAEEDPEAMYVIGMMYLVGKNVEQDYKQAREWFLESAKKGNSNAMLQLGRIYSLDENISKIETREDLAKKWLEEAVRLKNSRAYLEVGRMMETGFIYEMNPEKALKFYQLAAQSGSINSYAKLASMYLFGRGVKQDLRKSINYLRRLTKESKDKGIIKQAIGYLAQIYFDLAMQVPAGASKFQLYKLSYEHGNKQAADAMADMYQEGSGVKKNYLKALEWYEKSVKEFESVYAMEKIGFLYVQAPGDVPRDYKKAMEYFEQAARLGGVKGAYMIGYMYENGLGVSKDSTESSKWYARSKALEGRSTNKDNKAIFTYKPVY